MSQCTYEGGFNRGSKEAGHWSPCAGVKCSGFYKTPVPPSCECKCPSHVDQKCSEQKVFDDNLCECLCRDININCPGKSDFNFDTCNCVCPLRKDDCKSNEKLDPNRCECIKVHSPPTSRPPTSCPKLECRSDTQYWDPNTCKCRCRRFLVKKTYHYHHYRHGRSLYEADGGDEESRFRRSSSSGSSGRRSSSSGSDERQSPLYVQRCPSWKKADLKTCVCYW